MSKRVMTWVGDVAVPKEPVDSRKNKVYKALDSTSLNEEMFDSYTEAVEWTEAIVKSVWFRNRVPKNSHGESMTVRVDYTFDHYPYSYSGFYTSYIRLPYRRARKLGILHELAHILSPVDMANAKHGRRWANTLLKLVRRYMGDDAWRELKDSFIKNRVKYSLPTTKLANVFMESGDPVEYRLDVGANLREMVKALGEDGVVKITIRD